MNDDSLSNPYQAPASEVGWTAPEWAVIKAPWLVVPRLWHSPPVCLISGETEDLLPPFTRKVVSPSNPGLGLLILAHALLPLAGVTVWLSLAICVAVVATVLRFRKTARFHYYLCRRAAWRRRRRLALTWPMFFGGLTVWALSFDSSSSDFPDAKPGIAAFLLSASLLVKWSQFFIIRKVTAESVWLEGISPEVQAAIVRMECQTADNPPEAAPEPAPTVNAGW